MSPRKNVHERPKYVRESRLKATSRGREYIQTILSLSCLNARFSSMEAAATATMSVSRTLVSLWLYPTHIHACLYVVHAQNSLFASWLLFCLSLFFLSFYSVIVPQQSYTSVALAQPMRARRTPIQSYSRLGQVRRERQRVVSWSLVPRSGYGILTPSSGVWQAMAGQIDVSATSHPRHFAPLFTTRPLLLSSRFGTLLSGFPHPNRQTRPTTSRCPRPPTHRTKSRSCLLLPSLFTMAMRYPHYLGVVLHIRAT